MDRFRVMRPKNARRDWGRSGGIRVQAAYQVSLTHSSASSRMLSRFRAMLRQ